jgi:hypothetical protein
MPLIVKAKQRILDFDIENRPLTYIGNDFTTAEITAIAASWVGSSEIQTWLLGRDDPFDMLCAFCKLYDAADVVTGHYIRKHDLPIINGAMLEIGLRPLSPKLASDTKLDLIVRAGVSASQESLSGLLGLPASKFHMTQTMWRQANRLEALELTKRRVAGDVKQHKLLREELIALGWLGPPKMWGRARSG